MALLMEHLVTGPNCLLLQI